MAAYNPLGALLAEEAGFDGIWGSGFELVVSRAVPDANILPMGIHMDRMRAIVAAVATLVIADIDTGFGNAVNVSYVIPQYETAGISAVVMEDKTYPKDTSQRAGLRQELVSRKTFQGKIGASIDARQDNNFVITARVEALIVGLCQKKPCAVLILIKRWMRSSSIPDKKSR